MERILKLAEELAEAILDQPSVAEQVEALNTARAALHAVSPFSEEPVDFVKWVACDNVFSNDYNPNKVAPAEMKLLEHSIREDGYTQPIVTFGKGAAQEVVDGFHRNRVGKESPEVRARIHGFLPVVDINEERAELNDRVAATIRHNRARGKHEVTAMSDIVADLAKRNWSDKKISQELGMDPDEVLRLKQVTGLTELFLDREFSQAWEAENNAETD